MELLRPPQPQEVQGEGVGALPGQRVAEARAQGALVEALGDGGADHRDRPLGSERAARGADERGEDGGVDEGGELLRLDDRHELGLERGGGGPGGAGRGRLRHGPGQLIVSPGARRRARGPLLAYDVPASRMRIDSERVSVRNLAMERWGARLGLIALWIGGGTLAYAYRPASSCWTPMVLLALTSVVLGVQRGRSLAGGQRRGSPGGLWTDGERVHIAVHGRRHELARGDLVSGWIEPSDVRGVETLVLVTGDEREARMVLPQGTSGAAVLRAVGVGPEQRAVKISVQPAGTAAARASWIFVGTLVTGDGLPPDAGDGRGGALREPSARPSFARCPPRSSAGSPGGSTSRSSRPPPSPSAPTRSSWSGCETPPHRPPAPTSTMLIVDGGTVVLQRKGGEQLVVRSSPAGALALADRIAAALEVRTGHASDTLERLDRAG